MSTPTPHPVTRAELAALFENIDPFDEKERQDQAEVLSWIASGADLFRRVKPATPPQHLVSYFVVIAEHSILLVDHKLAGLWLPSGGHVDPDEHPRRTVEREVIEELGISLPFAADAPLFLTRQETVGPNPHLDVTLWYVLRARSNQQFNFDTREFHSIRWFGFDDVPVESAEPQLGRFLAKLRAQYGSLLDV